MAVSTPIYSSSTDGPVAVCTEEIPWRDTGNRVGIKLRDMSFSDRARRFNLRVAVGLTTSQAFSPRHRHTFEQIRYFIDGMAKFGEVVYQPGDCVYFPESVAYGPQIGVENSDCLHITLQFSGPSGIYYPTPEEQARAHAELAQTGTFVGGKYRWPDGREQDAFEATLEHMTGRPVIYAEPRYDRPIRMRVSAYAAIPANDEPRITVRLLASFNETGPQISFIEARAGAKLEAESSKSALTDVRFLLDGEARYGGRDYKGLSCFFFPAEHPHDAIEVMRDSRFLHVTFGSAA
jgi:hypothetical protein